VGENKETARNLPRQPHSAPSVAGVAGRTQIRALSLSGLLAIRKTQGHFLELIVPRAPQH
jgi:hypothetical protein